MGFDLLTKKQTPVGWARGEIGSVLLPSKQQKEIFHKVDDLRYDLRATKRIVSTAVFALAGALSFLGIASIYRTAKKADRAPGTGEKK